MPTEHFEMVEEAKMSTKIMHCAVPDHMVGGPFAVFYVCDGRISDSCTGIPTAKACDQCAREYSQAYDAPIVTPDLAPTIH